MPSLRSSLASLLVLLLSLAVAVLAAKGLTIPEGEMDFTFLGCFEETTEISTSGVRALNGGVSTVSVDMTVPSCLAFCANRKYLFAGLQYSRECWCSNRMSDLSEKYENDGACDLPCDGNATTACGGAMKLSVYKRSDGGWSARSPRSIVTNIVVTSMTAYFLL